MAHTGALARGIAHPNEVKSAALAAVAAGESPAHVAKRLRIPEATLKRWRIEYAIVAKPRSTDPDAKEVLGDKVYQAILATLDALTARARETAKPEWIAKQTAEGLAAMDATQWDRVVRVLGSFVPRDDAPDTIDPSGALAPERAVDVGQRNGAVDPAD